jgi:hypothetical protein
LKKYTWAGIAIVGLLVSACGNAAPVEPTFSPQDIQSTAVAAAFTIVAETQAAAPSNTPVPPTVAVAPTDLPTETPSALPNVIELASPTIVPTFTSQPAASGATADPCNQPLTSWQGPSASFNFIYEYKPQGQDDRVVLSLWVMTDLGECGFLTDLSTGPVGQYTAAAFIDGAKSFKVFGGFRITEAQWDIIIRNDVIIAMGSCYPGC